MKPYHKIQSLYKRDPDNHYKTFLIPEFSRPEFRVLEDILWVATEKVDGTNIRVHWDGERVWFGGRTDRAQLPVQLITALHDTFPAEKFAALYGDHTDFLLYGEGYGAGIQKGGKYRKDKGFILFDVLVDSHIWLERHNVNDIADKLGIRAVPILDVATLKEYVRGFTHGHWHTIGSVVAEEERPIEGLVLRPEVELKNRMGERIITKLKLKDFPQ